MTGRRGRSTAQPTVERGLRPAPLACSIGFWDALPFVERVLHSSTNVGRDPARPRGYTALRRYPQAKVHAFTRITTILSTGNFQANTEDWAAKLLR